MGNLHDFDITSDLVAFEQLTLQDKYLLHCLHKLCSQVTVIATKIVTSV